jgi:hypothetical protein
MYVLTAVLLGGKVQGAVMQCLWVPLSHERSAVTRAVEMHRLLLLHLGRWQHERIQLWLA